MLIQKTFHLHMLQEAAKAQLGNLPGYRRQFAGVELAVLTPEGGAHFVFELPWGFRADIELVRLPCENPAQTLFRSMGGNVEVIGVLEFFQIRPNLTEIVLTLDYTIGSPVFRMIDRFGHGVDRFLNRQLERLETHFATSGQVPAPINHHSVEEPR